MLDAEDQEVEPSTRPPTTKTKLLDVKATMLVLLRLVTMPTVKTVAKKMMVMQKTVTYRIRWGNIKQVMRVRLSLTRRCRRSWSYRNTLELNVSYPDLRYISDISRYPP
ncbi:hypothetical protein PHYPSEUDO_000482 [Phytophthora pseudosyringae]|uniref:Uncharacterized protein n=1 Tax=Phytophthora pseudosyringae TaxID=221518 RepID=A0A8T1W165_9STRA|nr:hypothetical protein PHYPSEUDO_000482 [Phytophthora pseudosyringae]